MLRTALRPRWLGFLALAGVAVWVLVSLGLWQFDVASTRGQDTSLDQNVTAAPVPIDRLVKPHESFPNQHSVRSVTAHGRYEPDKQLLVPDRVLDGERGYWVLTPIKTDSGARLVVLRGFVTDPAEATKPGTEPVTVTGALAPGESPGPIESEPGRIGAVDIAALVNEWPGPMYNAFVFLTDEKPSVSGSAIVKVPPPPPSPATGFNLMNFMYGVQWWLFAAFAVYIYWRMLRDEVERDTPRPKKVRRSKQIAAIMNDPSDSDPKETP